MAFLGLLRQNDELARPGREARGRRRFPGAVVVFDANAEFARQVDAGLDRHDVAGRERSGVSVHEVGRLVAGHAEAVAETRGEGLAGARVLDDLASGPVDVLARSPGPQWADAGQLRPVHGGVDLA